MLKCFRLSLTAALAFSLGVSVPALAQVSITTLGTPSTQNFDSLANSGSSNTWTDNVTIPGWYSTRTVYIGSNGTNAGGLHSLGTTSTTERALGSAASNTTADIFWAVRLKNDTSSEITSLAISYVGEQWRDGGSATPNEQTLSFEYQIGATGVITGANTPSTGWFAGTPLDFNSPIFTNTGSGIALDGNADANKRSISATLIVSVPPGDEIWLRWHDVNNTGNDHVLAVDNFSVIANPPPKLSLISSTQGVGEGSTGCVGGSTPLNFYVMSSQTPTSDISFTFTTTDGTANLGSDFTTTGTGVITAGNTSGNATIDVICDDVYEADETFTITLTDNANPDYDLGTPIAGTGTIANDDMPDIQVSANSVNLSEGGTATFEVTLSGAPAGDTTFDVASNDTGAATVSPATLTFTPGDFNAPKTVTVSGVADLDLANESAIVSLSSAGYTTTNVTANIADDDTQAIVVAPASLNLVEGNASAVDVSLAFQPAADVTVNVASLDTGAASATPASLIFTPLNYATTQAVAVTGEQDADQDNESTSIEFTATGVTTTTVNVNVTDDDATLPTVTLTGGGAFSEGNGCTTTDIGFTATSSTAAGAGGLTVHYTIGGGTADGSDLTLGAATVVITEAATSANFNVPVNCDFTVEPNDTFDVTLTADAAYTVGAPASASGTITNDDAALTLSIAPVSQPEPAAGAATMTFTATLDQAVPTGYGPVSLTLTTGDSGAGPTHATAGSDYVAKTEALSIAEGATSATFVVSINSDTDIEQDETFNVAISATSGQNTTFPMGPIVGTITNDDSNTTVSVPPSLAINEGNTGTSTATVTVSTDTIPVGGSASVDYASTGGTATADVDFVSTSGTAAITCAAGPALPCTATINVTINGDLRNEAAETFTLTISNPQGTNVVLGNATTTVTIGNDDTAAERTIEQIQGSGHVSPDVNTVVATLGNIVTAVLPAPNGGFIIQVPDAAASGDTATSNGLYVFTGATPTGVAIGDEVDVRGTIVEFGSNGATAAQRVTEFSNTGLLFSVRSSGNALPAPIVLDAVTPSPNPATPSCGAVGNFECYEGMRVTTTTGMVNLGNQTFGVSDPVAEMWITTSGQRAVREGGLLPSKTGETVPTLNPAAPPVPSTYVYDQNPEVFELDLNRAGLPNDPLVPGTTFSATGVLVQEFGGFELWPTSFAVNTAAPALPAPVVDALPTELTIGSQNLHLLFDDINDAWNAEDCTPGPDYEIDFCPDTTRWNAKLNLLSRQIREQLKSPMVVAVQEVEKQGALDALANKINTDLGMGSPFTYSAHVGDIEDLDGGHQNVGFLIRSDVTVLSLTQLNTTQEWTFNGSPQGEVMDRPPYLLRATVELLSGAPFEFAVMALHQRSLSGIDNLSTSVDPDNSPLTFIQNAHRVRQKRLYQAALTAQGIQQFQTANPEVPLYVLGDFNAYTESDGYVDVTGIIQGTTDPALSQYDLSFFSLEGSGPNGNIVVPSLISASALAPASERYSYQFQSMPQQIDHAMMNAAGVDRFLDIHFARNNVDQQARYLISFNNSLGTETPLVSSDHDGFVLYVDPRADDLFKDSFE